MGAGAALMLLGAIIALLFLPETRNLRSPREIPNPHSPQPVIHGEPSQWAELFSTFAFLGASRLVSAGILLPTLGSTKESEEGV
jgi:hypothetical protein